MSRKLFALRRKKKSDAPLAIDILSVADKFGGQGVGSAFREQSRLAEELPKEDFSVTVNSPHLADIIHCHSVEPMNYVRMKLTGEISVVHCHYLPETLMGSIHLPRPIMEVYCRYVIEFYRAADWIVVVNPDFIPKLEAYGIPKERIRYIPNYVSGKNFYEKTAEEKAAFREKMGIPQDSFVVLGVGQVQSRKGVADFAELARRLPEYRFVWCGGFSFGPITDGYDELKQLVDNPPENLLFTGIVERTQMNDYYNLADVFFLPSYGELFPMCVLESAAVGVPLLLRNLELYENILFGNYISGENNDDFEKALIRLKEDPEFRAQAARRSSAVHEFYSPEAVQKQWKDFYSTIARDAQK